MTPAKQHEHTCNSAKPEDQFALIERPQISGHLRIDSNLLAILSILALSALIFIFSPGNSLYAPLFLLLTFPIVLFFMWKYHCRHKSVTASRKLSMQEKLKVLDTEVSVAIQQRLGRSTENDEMGGE